MLFTPIPNLVINQSRIQPQNFAYVRWKRGDWIVSGNNFDCKSDSKEMIVSNQIELRETLNQLPYIEKEELEISKYSLFTINTETLSKMFPEKFERKKKIALDRIKN